MLSQEELLWVLDRAYVPEHVVPLMESLSGGEAHLLKGHLVVVGKDWSILVGYPLDAPGQVGNVEEVLWLLRSRFNPESIWFIGPDVPRELERHCQERERDSYFRIDLRVGTKGEWNPPSRLKNTVEKAKRKLRVDRGDVFGPAHKQLTELFLASTKLSPRVRELYLRIPSYLESQAGGVLLSAWDSEHRLAAYSVMELGAREFSVYLLGCQCRQSWAAYASDLLMAEMIHLSLEEAKSYIHLGLGVNPGIRRFKEKWGGFAWMPYEMCGWQRRLSASERLARALGGSS